MPNKSGQNPAPQRGGSTAKPGSHTDDQYYKEAIKELSVDNLRKEAKRVTASLGNLRIKIS